jgi:acetyl-CoA carboxylase biotin carboxyl carrier protein
MTKKEGSFDKDLVRELAALLDETGLTEIEIEHEGKRVRVARSAAPVVSSYLPDVSGPEMREGSGPRGGRDEFVVHPAPPTVRRSREHHPSWRSAATSPSGRLSSSSKP